MLSQLRSEGVIEDAGHHHPDTALQRRKGLKNAPAVF